MPSVYPPSHTRTQPLLTHTRHDAKQPLRLTEANLAYLGRRQEQKRDSMHEFMRAKHAPFAMGMSTQSPHEKDPRFMTRQWSQSPREGEMESKRFEREFVGGDGGGKRN